MTPEEEEQLAETLSVDLYPSVNPDSIGAGWPEEFYPQHVDCDGMCCLPWTY